MAERKQNKRKAISNKIRFEVFKRDNFKCQYCGASAPEVILHVDHIKPVSKGGTNHMTNLITSCSVCNNGKRAIPLDDSTEIEKQKRQLEELNERRRQLEMMMKWREELTALDDMKYKFAHDKWSSLSGYHVNEHGEKELRAIIKKYPLEMVLDAIESSVMQYLELDENGENSKESVEKAFNYISRICANKKRIEDKPYLKDLFYIRGILRNRLRYIDIPKSLDYLEKAYLKGATIESLIEVAKSVNHWTEFRNTVEDFLEG